MPLYAYHCTWCEVTTEKLFTYEEKPSQILCPNCDDYPAVYTMSKPAHIKIGYEQNGRKAVKVDMGNGKKTHRSMTRENFEHNMGNLSNAAYKEKNHLEKRKLNDSVYTKGYQEHLKKKGELP